MTRLYQLALRAFPRRHLVNWDASTKDRELRLLYDLEAWGNAKSDEEFSVSRNVQRNLIVGNRPPDVVMVAEISASAFARPASGRIVAGRCCRKRHDLRAAAAHVEITIGRTSAPS